MTPDAAAPLPCDWCGAPADDGFSDMDGDFCSAFCRRKWFDAKLNYEDANDPRND